MSADGTCTCRVCEEKREAMARAEAAEKDRDEALAACAQAYDAGRDPNIAESSEIDELERLRYKITDAHAKLREAERAARVTSVSLDGAILDLGSLRDAMREIGFRISTIQCGAHQGRYEEGCDTCRGIEVIHHLASGDHREQWTAIHEARDARNRAAAAIHERDEARAERNRLRERFAVDKESGTGLDELIAYVRRRMAEVAAEGGIYDNGFWCVDEAEQAFEVDAESFAEFAGRLEGAEAAAASLRERVRALAEAAGVLADNVVNLRGHYDANPHLASTSVRQGLASLADLAATLRALLAPTKETSREAPLVRCGCGQGWCKECNPAERIAIVERAIQMALDAFGGGPTLNITATQGEALDALRNACSELVVLGYDAAAKTPSRSLTPIGSEPCPSPTKETTTDETDFDGGGSDA